MSRELRIPRKVNVLLIDGEESARLASAAFLEGAGHHVHAVADAGGALGVLDGHQVDVAVVDISPPSENGLDIACRIRERQPNTRIILCTREPVLESARAAVQLRAFDYLTKPVVQKQIIDAVGRAAEEKWRLDESDRLLAERTAFRERLEPEEAERTAVAVQREDLLSMAQELGRIGTWHLDMVNNKLTWTDETYRLFGIPAGTPLTYEVFLDCVHPDDRAYVDREWSNRVKTNEYDIEHRLLVEGDVRWVREKAEVTFDDHGRAVSAIGFTQDITELKRAQRQVAMERDRAERYLDIAGVMLIALDDQQTVTMINRRGCEILGTQRDEIIGTNWFSTFLPPEQVDEVKAVYDQIIAGEIVPVEYFENQVVRANGEYRDIAWHNSVVRDSDGNVIEVLCSGEDITQRRQAEHRFREVLHASPFPVALVDEADERIHFWSRSAVDLFGHEPSTTGEWYALAYPDPEYLQDVLARWSLALDEARQATRAVNTGEYDIMCADGSVRTCELWAQFVQGNLVVILNDVTDRKEAEERLRREYDLSRSIIDHGPVGVVIVNRDGAIESANLLAQEILSLSASDIEGRAYNDPEWRVTAVDGSDFPDSQLPVPRVLDTDEPVNGVEHAIEWPNGERRMLSINAAPLRDEDGVTERVVCALQDITEQKGYEARLHHLLQVLRAVRDVNQLITHEKAQDALLCRACEILTETRGYRSVWIGLLADDGDICQVAQSGIGEQFRDFAESVSGSAYPACVRCALEQQEVVTMRGTQENCTSCPLACTLRDSAALAHALRHEQRDYGVIVVALPAELAEDQQEQALFAELAADIGYALHGIETERARQRDERARRALEDQLRQAQKMEAIGRLAGGVAHDFNNMLGVIIGRTELMLSRAEGDSRLAAGLREVEKAAQRSADLTRQLLAFARRQTVAPKVLDMNTTLESMLNMLRRLIGEGIDLVWHPGAELWPVRIDPAQLDQVLANLCVNARDAMSGSGALTIETCNTVLDEADCVNFPEYSPGSYVMLAVSDTGCGMDEATLSRVFEPFYTTKEMGEGTGLGLATVYGIVKQNGGIVTANSEPGAGTSFKVYLPRRVGEAPEDDRDVQVVLPRARGETVLLVEDDVGLLKGAMEMLEELGYTVLVANGPSRALDLAREAAQRIDLLVTDVVMPSMNGRRLANSITELCPQVKTLFMSGYTANAIAHNGVLDEGVHFLQKPFSLHDLAVHVRQALED